ncbi:hypothetical protein DFH06DRAFT_1123893 [Mycena polygramma]|nr:hypothetical protein DFH06DRAFT_1123893 [Mycena polygramma]
MDPSTIRRFLSTNIEWPGEKLFIPRGGLTNFLYNNLRFKVFLVMTAVFTDAYVFDTVKSLTTAERLGIRFHVRDIVRHMIRQNEFRVHYESGVVPSEAAWLFHVILVLLVMSQATFFLGAALATFVSHKEDGFDDAQLDFPAYDSARWVSGNIHYRARPSSFHPIPIVDTLADPFDYNPHKSVLCPTLPVVHEAEDVADAAEIIAALDASFWVIKKMPTRRSYRVLASHLAEGPLVPDEFFVKEEERALSECSSGSMPSLVTPFITGGSTTV